MSDTEIGWYLTNRNRGFFLQDMFVAAVTEWNNAQKRGEPSKKFLKDIISDAENLVSGESFYPDYHDRTKLVKWQIDQSYTGLDRKLLDRFLQGWDEVSDYSGDGIKDNKIKSGKFDNVPDWKISFACGAETLTTLGANLWNGPSEDSPCRVPVPVGKTSLDAFSEATGGTVDMGFEWVGDRLQRARDEITDTIFDVKLLVLVGLVAAATVYLISKEAA